MKIFSTRYFQIKTWPIVLGSCSHHQALASNINKQSSSTRMSTILTKFNTFKHINFLNKLQKLKRNTKRLPLYYTTSINLNRINSFIRTLNNVNQPQQKITLFNILINLNTFSNINNSNNFNKANFDSFINLRNLNVNNLNIYTKINNFK